MNRNRHTRRTFIKNAMGAAAGTVAAPYVITSTALGNGSIPPAGERIALGHIGVGNMGGHLLNCFLGLSDAQSVAVCDPYKSRREMKAKQVNDHYAARADKATYKGCAAYNDFRELMARDDIDAVVVATPDHWHVPLGLAAARSGKDMYVEKPLGISVAHDIALRQACQRYGRVFQYGTMQRSAAHFRFACELVRNGRIGKVNLINVWCPCNEAGGSTTPIPVPEDLDYDLWLGPAPWAPYTKDRCVTPGVYHISDYAIGYLGGWGSHPLDIAQWGNDTEYTSPVEYEGTGVFPTEGLYDTQTSWDVMCTYANGVKLRFMSPDVAHPISSKYGLQGSLGTMWVGDKGWVDVDRSRVYADPPSLLNEKIGPNEIHLYESNDHRQNFLDCIKTRAKTICPVEQAVRSDTISHLSDIAIRTGRKIKWDPEREQITGDEVASRMLSRPMRAPWRL